jgi:NADPH:quinone reductase-like Zn-dependent oxidoreductase
MKAAVLREVNRPLEVEEVQIDRPGPREALVRTRATGDTALVEVTFTNFGQPTRLVFSLLRIDGAWLIDEIEAPDGPYPWRLGDILKAR